MQIMFTLDVSTKFYPCFLCLTEEQRQVHRSAMVRVDARSFEKFYNENGVYTIGYVCPECSDKVVRMSFMHVPNHIPKKQLQKYLRMFKRKGEDSELQRNTSKTANRRHGPILWRRVSK